MSKNFKINKMVFEQSELGTIKLKNRIFRSATHEGLADEKGYLTNKLIRRYEGLAKNEIEKSKR